MKGGIMIEIHYLAHSDSKKSEILSWEMDQSIGMSSFLGWMWESDYSKRRAADYMLGVEDWRVKVRVVQNREDGIVYSIRAEPDVWDFYITKTQMSHPPIPLEE